MNKNILVIGSSNTDMVVKTDRHPKPGETIIGGEFFMFPGGKGANQAVAAARLGGQVTFICKVGDDIFGKQAFDGFKKAGIQTEYVLTTETHPSGVALITVNAVGENEIVVAPGANHQLAVEDINDASEAIATAEIVLLQLETPIHTVEYAIQKAFRQNKKVVLNPAPAQPLSEHIFSALYLVTPNETEAEILTGINVNDQKTAAAAAVILLNKGVQNVLITLGAKGSFFKNTDQEFLIPALIVKTVDTTAAGDVFNGALCVALAREKPWQEAIEFATQAAAVSVTRMGAQASAPYLHELSN